MGGGKYSLHSRSTRSNQKKYKTQKIDQIFEKRSIDNQMNPKGVRIRESRDSEGNPNSNAILINLDVTGSMGRIPHELIKNGLPNLVAKLYKEGVKNPQIL